MCHVHLSKAAACLLAAWVPIPCQCHLQAAWTSHPEYKRYRVLSMCSLALDSSQCMLEINHPSLQVATRPKLFGSCVPDWNSACFVITSCSAASRTPTCMHDPQVRVPRRPAYSGPRLHQARTHLSGAGLRCMGAPPLLPCHFLHLSSKAACLFARHGHEAHSRADLIPAACPAVACTAI